MLVMNSPLTASRLLLVADPRQATAAREKGAVRRYRLARLRFDGRSAEYASRFDHLKRVYD